MDPRHRRRRGPLMAKAIGAVSLIAQVNAAAYLMGPSTPRLRPAPTSRIRPSCHPTHSSSRDLFPSAITTTSFRHQKHSPSPRFYVNEWADADVELSFHTENKSTFIPKKQLPLFKHLILQFTAFLHKIKEFIRTRIIERCTVYILELENGKYYVGSTTNRKRRIQEHIRQRGSKWTRTHKPIRVLREYKRIPSKFVLGMESRITAECMLEFGVNNVRGSMFCGTREFHVGDVAALTKFIGHYNDLSYRKVRDRLNETLPDAPRRVKVSYNDGRCFRCGKRGHFAARCPERYSSRDSNAFV
jgi:hypothetical protein